MRKIFAISLGIRFELGFLFEGWLIVIELGRPWIPLNSFIFQARRGFIKKGSTAFFISRDFLWGNFI